MSYYSPLLTDLYQLTMAYGYWRLNMHEREACFHVLFRKNPFKSNYALSCGLESVLDFFKHWRFKEDDLAYLANLFPQDFLTYLRDLKFTCDVDAVPEGTVVFAHTPLIRIQGPLLQCQLIETPLLNRLNFQTLIATKATRVCRAAQGEPVIEFGMRRAQGPDGALSASRAAYIGGCVATSNTLAGKLFDIPVRGTHAHSWVSAFDTELAAFEAFAKVMPNNCTLLVDTYNTLEGVKHAIQVGQKLRAEGADLLAIRLDSGDLADLSIQARKLLDAAGFHNTIILASNALDEHVIAALKQQHAPITIWGVGTSLVTAYDQPALDGVYKLSALRDQQGQWQYKLKLSEQMAKISNPGRHQVRRFFYNEQYLMDVIYDCDLGIAETPQPVLLEANMPKVHLGDYDAFVDLLQPFLRKGKRVRKAESIHAVRERAAEAVRYFWEMQKDDVYPVGLEERLYALKQTLVDKFSGKSS